MLIQGLPCLDDKGHTRPALVADVQAQGGKGGGLGSPWHCGVLQVARLAVGCGQNIKEKG